MGLRRGGRLSPVDDSGNGKQVLSATETCQSRYVDTDGGGDRIPLASNTWENTHFSGSHGS
ncbi:hypothetical protein RMSM_00766 [Rhodopirellula maiorica SM1]|uniref:Uncharacterized protein n=1 Tax=Rhodopirellula maiorica SM1 TaxID=1265738 RepID=M5S830_9BACT|nr:hypothetical protein [Rhodopirellula maiorica]EMI22319.1 hypothetical protein RMSM_00766 [Rhodopirellula maiorica SM1]